MQIKTKMLYHETHTRMAKTEQIKLKNQNDWHTIVDMGL